jgi:ribosomal protein S4E
LTPEEFVDALIGQDWEPWQLPVLLSFVINSMEDAERYRVVRDYAKKLTFNEHPRDRAQLKAFDDLVDSQKYHYLN